MGPTAMLRDRALTIFFRRAGFRYIPDVVQTRCRQPGDVFDRHSARGRLPHGMRQIDQQEASCLRGPLGILWGDGTSERPLALAEAGSGPARPPPRSRLAYTAPSWVLRPFPAWTAVLYPFGELRVHHEVVDVLLCFGELQLPGHHGHHEGSAASTLWADSKRAGGERTSSRGQVWGSPAVGARALWLVRGTEPVGTLIPAPTRGSVALLARLQS